MTEKTQCQLTEKTGTEQTGTEQFLEGFDTTNKTVQHVIEIFKESYGSAMKPLRASTIINGENIRIDDCNQLIDDCSYEDENFEVKEKWITKKLYSYQKKALFKLLEFEKNGFFIDRESGKKIITNACLLKIACGSGKSLIFEILSVFYRDVPNHPIIISVDGSKIPEYEQLPFKYYPFYYEVPAFEEGVPNCVVSLKDYKRTNQTIILTHSHLLEQMKEYFETDMPKAIKKTKILYCSTFDEYRTNADIVLMVANSENVSKLCAMSYDKPFMRVIVDDYTSMTDLESFRQIRASSTIFVSGTGFLSRKPEEIPAGYYTLKLSPVDKISIVGNPNETWKGIIRNNIACINLIGSNNEFSTYEFIQKLEESSKGIWRCSPGQFYPILEKEPILKHSLAAMFLILNKNRLIKAIQNINRDYGVFEKIFSSPSESSPKSSEKTRQKETEKVSVKFSERKFLRNHQIEQKMNVPEIPNESLDENRNGFDEISFFVRWIEMLGRDSPFVQECMNNFRASSGESTPIVSQRCFCCGAEIMKHANYGCVACCCGCFYCSQCLKNMATHKIHIENHEEILFDKENIYCTCCHQKNPKYFINITKKKDRNVFAISLIKEFFDCSDLKNHINFDYYFKMFLDGLVPLFAEGKAIDIQEEGCVFDSSENPSGKSEMNPKNPSKNSQKTRIPRFPCIYPREQLLIKAIANIQKVLEVEKITIKPNVIPIILIYGSPRHLQIRITSYFRDLCRMNPSSQLNKIALMFKNDVGSLIGLQKSIIGIILFDTPKNMDELTQTNARLIRISPQYSDNDINFYIKASSI